MYANKNITILPPSTSVDSHSNNYYLLKSRRPIWTKIRGRRLGPALFPLDPLIGTCEVDWLIQVVLVVQEISLAWLALKVCMYVFCNIQDFRKGGERCVCKGNLGHKIGWGEFVPRNWVGRGGWVGSFPRSTPVWIRIGKKNEIKSAIRCAYLG